MEEVLSIRISAELKAELVALAAELDRPITWVVRKALAQYLASSKEVHDAR